MCVGGSTAAAGVAVGRVHYGDRRRGEEQKRQPLTAQTGMYTVSVYVVCAYANSSVLLCMSMYVYITFNLCCIVNKYLFMHYLHHTLH